MTLDEFRTLAETWGGDIHRWPEQVRSPAAEIGRTPAGEAVLRGARELDRWMAGAAPDVSIERAHRAIGNVLTAIAREAPSPRRSTPLLRWLVPSAGFACAAALGASLAVALPAASSRQSVDAATILIWLLDSAASEQDWGLR